MSRCVPNWDLDDDDAPAATRSRLSFLGPDLPSVDSEVAELTWENGQLSLHGLGQPRLNSKPAATTGTLEFLMNQAAAAVGNKAVPISGSKPLFACAADLIPWLEPSQSPTDVVTAASGTMTMDALVPCAAASSDDPRRQAMWLLADSAGRGDCREWGDHQSASGSATFSHRVTTLDTFEHERELDNATSEGSPDNTQSGKVGGERATDTTTEEHDSVYSRPRREEEEEKRSIGKSSLSTKRSRAVAIHNQSERKRRDKINQKMKTLQKLVPNSSKTDKASVLDEVIDYLKQLQAQVQLMTRMNMMPPQPMLQPQELQQQLLAQLQLMNRMNMMPPQPMLLPLALQQQLQMSMMAPPILGLGLAGMPGIMAGDMSSALGVTGCPNIPGIPPVPFFLHPYMPMASWDGTLGPRFAPPASCPVPVMPDPLSAFLAGQSSPNFDMQAMALDAHSRMAAIYQQQQQPQNPNN